MIKKHWAYTKKRGDVIQKIREDNLKNPRRYWSGKKRSIKTIEAIRRANTGRVSKRRKVFTDPLLEKTISLWNDGKSVGAISKILNKYHNIVKSNLIWAGINTEQRYGGRTPWNKGKKGVMPKVWNKGKTGFTSWNKGCRGVQVAWNKGLPNDRWLGKNNPRWKGGITPKNKQIRHTLAYKQWIRDVFQRDNYACRNCGVRSGNGRGVYLHAHHIKTFSEFPNLRFDLSNGITLCKCCHRKIHNKNDSSVNNNTEL